MGHGHSHIHTTPHHHHSHAATPHHQHSTPLAHSSYPGAIQIGHTPHHHPHPPDTPGPQVETILQNACFCARNELIMILKEIKVCFSQSRRCELTETVSIIRIFSCWITLTVCFSLKKYWIYLFHLYFIFLFLNFDKKFLGWLQYLFQEQFLFSSYLRLKVE